MWSKHCICVKKIVFTNASSQIPFEFPKINSHFPFKSFKFFVSLFFPFWCLFLQFDVERCQLKCHSMKSPSCFPTTKRTLFNKKIVSLNGKHEIYVINELAQNSLCILSLNISQTHKHTHTHFYILWALIY